MLETHECTDDELGFGRDISASRFYEPTKESALDVRRMTGNWHCINKNQTVNLKGYYSSVEATNLIIRLKRCDNATMNGTCDTLDAEKDLRSFYLATLTNERLFDVSLPVGRQSFEQSVITWNAISLKTPVE